jgi:hypothetical protein
MPPCQAPLQMHDQLPEMWKSAESLLVAATSRFRFRTPRSIVEPIAVPSPRHAATRRTLDGAHGGCRQRNQRVHKNPVTLVTPTIHYLTVNLSHDQRRVMGVESRRELVTGAGRPPNAVRKGTHAEGYPMEGEKFDDDTHDRDT